MLKIISYQRNTRLSHTEILVSSNGTVKIKTNNLNVRSDVEHNKFAGRSKMAQTFWKMVW